MRTRAATVGVGDGMSTQRALESAMVPVGDSVTGCSFVRRAGATSGGCGWWVVLCAATRSRRIVAERGEGGRDGCGGLCFTWNVRCGEVVLCDGLCLLTAGSG